MRDDDWNLIRLALGELPADDAASLEASLARDGDRQQQLADAVGWLDELTAAAIDVAATEVHCSQGVVERRQQPIEPRRRNSRWSIVPGFVTAMAACCLGAWMIAATWVNPAKLRTSADQATIARVWGHSEAAASGGDGESDDIVLADSTDIVVPSWMWAALELESSDRDASNEVWEN